MNCPVDLRTDLYSLGVLFYEGLAGQIPFPTEDKNELVHRHIALVPEPPLVASSEFERGVSAVTARKAPVRFLDLRVLVTERDFASEPGRLRPNWYIQDQAISLNLVLT